MGERPEGPSRGKWLKSALDWRNAAGQLLCSPHARGWSQHAARQPPGARVLPARAGLVPAPSGPRRCGRCAPRTRGVGPRCQTSASVMVKCRPPPHSGPAGTARRGRPSTTVSTVDRSTPEPPTTYGQPPETRERPATDDGGAPPHQEVPLPCSEFVQRQHQRSQPGQRSDRRKRPPGTLQVLDSGPQAGDVLIVVLAQPPHVLLGMVGALQHHVQAPAQPRETCLARDRFSAVLNSTCT